MSIVITKQSWSDWKQHPVTKELVKALYEKRESLKEAIVEEKYGADVLKWMGYTQSLKDEINFIMEDWKLDLIDDEDVA